MSVCRAKLKGFKALIYLWTLLSSPLLSSCPWVIHISSLASPFPILFLTSPCLLCTYQLCFLFPVPFPLSPLSPSPLITLHVISILWLCSCFSCLLSFCFLDSVVDSCGFVVILLVIVLVMFFFLDNPFNISYNKGLMMMDCFILTLSGKHFICPSILALLDRVILDVGPCFLWLQILLSSLFLPGSLLLRNQLTVLWKFLCRKLSPFFLLL